MHNNTRTGVDEKWHHYTHTQKKKNERKYDATVIENNNKLSTC